MVYYNYVSGFKFTEQIWCLISLIKLMLLFMRMLLFAKSFFLVY